MLPQSLAPRRSLVRLASALVVLGAALRLIKFVQNHSFWLDEAMVAINLGSRSFSGLLEPLDFSQLAPIPWLWLEKTLFLVGGMNELVLRTPALIAGVVLPWLVWRAGVRLTGPQGALIATALTSTGTALLFYSVELKPYAIDATVAALLMLVTARSLGQAPADRRLHLIGVLGVAAVLLSFTAVFVLGASGTVLLAQAVRERSRRRAATIGGWGVLWSLAFAVPQLLVYRATGTGTSMQSFWEPALARVGEPGFLSRASLATNSLLLTVLDVQVWPGTQLFLLVMVVGAWAVLRRRGLPALVVVAGPLVLLALAWVLNQVPANVRLFLFVAPGVALLLGAALVQLVEWFGPRSRRAATAIAAMLVIAIMVDGGHSGLQRQKPSGGRELIQRVMAESPAPVWLNVTGAPAWLVYTTNWDAPDLARLAWHVANNERDRRRVLDRTAIMVDTAGLRVWRGRTQWERVAGPSGLRSVAGGQRDAGLLEVWAAAEADNLLPWLSQRPWLVMNHQRPGELAALLRALADRGVGIDSIDATRRGSLWRLQAPHDSGHTPSADTTSSMVPQR